MSDEVKSAVESSEPAPANGNGNRKKIFRIVGPIVLIAVLAYGFKQYTWSHSHEATDNAQVASDVIQVSPQVSGIVAEVKVKENEVVRKGQLLVRLDDDKLQAAYRQAKANLASAIADADAAGIAVDYTRASGAATQLESSGTVTQADAGIGTARAGISTATAVLSGSEASERSAQVDVSSAQADRQSARDNLGRAQAAVRSAQASVESAASAIKANEAAVRNAVSQNELAQRNLEREKYLNEQGATSKQQLDTAATAAASSAAALDSAQQQLNMAKSALDQRRADLASAVAQERAAQTAITQASLKIDASRQRLLSARANVEASRQQISSAQQGYAAANGKKTQSLGQAQQAGTLSIQVKQKEAARQQALAKVEQAKAALRTAELDLEHAQILAPCEGRVTKKLVEPGNLVQIGSALMAIIPDDAAYVVANFKETQVASLKPGQPVAIEVDAFPGKEFHGHIDSASAATGATFALLPPDNATGNFVKVVQRVPVKIDLDDSPEQQALLHVGMSALVTVKVN